MYETATLNGCAVTCRNLQPADRADVKQMITDAFPQAVETNPKALDILEQEPWYDPAHVLVAEVEGRVVSHVGIRAGLLCFSGIGVPAGLVGTVCTATAVRGQGVGSVLMRASFEHMQRDRLAVSCLHTSPERFGFYRRLGYRKAIIETPRLILPLANLDLDVACPQHTQARAAVRSATAADAQALHRIYAAQYVGQVSGSWSRTVPFWERRLQHRPKLFAPPQPMTFRVTGSDGPVAYVAVLEAAPDKGTVGEWACLPGAEEEALQLLYTTLRQWRDRGLATAQLALSTCHPMRPLIEPLLAQDQTGHTEIWVRVQNHNLYIETIRPLLERRSRAAGRRLEITFREHGRTLTIGRGETLQLETHASDLCSLIYNGRRLPGLLEEGGIATGTGGDAALPLIFPDTGASRCAQDVY
jgi:predicted acetyltransferase